MSKLMSKYGNCPLCEGKLKHIRYTIDTVKMIGRVEPYHIKSDKIKCLSCEKEWHEFEIIFNEDWDVKMIILED